MLPCGVSTGLAASKLSPAVSDDACSLFFAQPELAIASSRHAPIRILRFRMRDPPRAGAPGRRTALAYSVGPTLGPRLGRVVEAPGAARSGGDRRPRGTSCPPTAGNTTFRASGSSSKPARFGLVHLLSAGKFRS